MSLKIIILLNGALLKAIQILETILFLIVGIREVVSFIFIKQAVRNSDERKDSKMNGGNKL